MINKIWVLYIDYQQDNELIQIYYVVIKFFFIYFLISLLYKQTGLILSKNESQEIK